MPEDNRLDDLKGFREHAVRVIKGLFVILAFLVGIVWLWWEMASDEKKYSIYYGVPRDRVVVEKEPHDCEFLTAPLGNKHCHYDKHVSKVKLDEPNSYAVYVTFEKIQD